MISIVTATIGWLVGDWRRVLGLVGLLAIAGAYVTGDARGRNAEAVAWKTRFDAQSAAYLKSADAARAAEQQRQVQVGIDLKADFDKRLAAQDAAASAAADTLEQEITTYETALAKKGVVRPRITADDLTALGLHNPQPAAARGGH